MALFVLVKFGTDTYRAGAMERINDARLLMEKGQLAGGVYYAGVAVECMLRSLVWLKDRRLDERHDLRQLAVRIEHLGLLRRGDADVGFVGTVQQISSRWQNSIRFASTDQFVRLWTDLGVLRRNRTGELKTHCRMFLSLCADVIQRCEVLWQFQRRRN